MKVNLDLSITESDILLSALQEYKTQELCYMNHARVELIQSLIDRISLCK